MFLKFLDKIGRKKQVLDRGRSHPEFHKAKPWMNRYYVLFRHRPKWFPFNILIHEMLADDHGEGVHTHLCPYMTIVLRDGYWETLKSGKYWRAKGYIGFSSSRDLVHTCTVWFLCFPFALLPVLIFCLCCSALVFALPCFAFSFAVGHNSITRA